MMYTNDWLTPTGIHIHLSMSNYNTCYIFVNDIYDNQLTMRYFTDMDSAVEFINNL
jgi:3-deoxy-D-arabino-heptulosonate 7-phosphate (DAHP) synthase class II